MPQGPGTYGKQRGRPKKRKDPLPAKIKLPHKKNPGGAKKMRKLKPKK